MRPFYNVRHRANDADAVTRGLRQGANAVEFDVRLVDGEFVVSHDVSDPARSLPAHLEMLRRAASDVPAFSLVLVDVKDPDPARAASLHRTIRQGLARSGLWVVFSTASFTDRDFVGRIGDELGRDEGVAIDQHDSPTDVARFFNARGITRFGYGNGTFAYGFEVATARSIHDALSDRALSGRPPFVYVWTLDDRSAQLAYLRVGVDAILTNDVDDLSHVLRREAERGRPRRLATRSDDPFGPGDESGYRVEIHTGDVTHAGTDADVTITLGEDPRLQVVVDTSFVGICERGDVNHVGITGPDIGLPTSVTLARNDGGNAPGWWVDRIVVVGRDPAHVGEYRFERWVARRGVTAPLGEARYEMTVVTGDVGWAGTDALVTFAFADDAGNVVTKRVSGADAVFERNGVDVVRFHGPRGGPFRRMRVRHNGAGLADGWFLERVLLGSEHGVAQFDVGRFVEKDRPVTRTSRA
jgi:glycerophosphoryl diester phosphodiesterase